jgi:hypothetical protein
MSAVASVAPRSSSKAKRRVVIVEPRRCECASTKSCEGVEVELTARKIEHDADDTELHLCEHHRRCLHCDAPVDDYEFYVVDGKHGVGCAHPERCQEDVDNACTFVCGSCDRVCLADMLNDAEDEDGEPYDWDDGQFRCTDCSGECCVCAEQWDQGKWLAATDRKPERFLCARCVPEDEEDE